MQIRSTTDPSPPEHLDLAGVGVVGATGVAVRGVTFPSGGETLVGTLFLPMAEERGAPLAAVIVDGPWTQVKEQVGYRYARALAVRGFAALAFDHRGWGESGGSPRSLESTRLKVEDLKAALDYLQDVPGVDGGRVGVLGVCAAAGNMALAVAEDDRISSLVAVAAWLQHPETTPLFYGGAEGIARRIEAAEAARERHERTGEVEYVAAYDPAEGSDAAMFFPLDYYGNLDRGAIPQWRNEFAVMGWKEWLELDAIAPAVRICVPALVVHGDGCALPDNVRRFFDQLAGPKDLLWTEGEHTEFYDAEPRITVAADAAAAHFARTLGATTLGAASGSEKQAVSDAVSALLWAVDRQDWAAIRAALADHVRTDYTSLFGGEPQEQPAEELVAAWRGLLPGFDATQHLLGPILVSLAGERATARCAVTATHELVQASWIVGGHYEIELQRAAGWLVRGIRLHTAFVHGDTELPARAQERAKDLVER